MKTHFQLLNQRIILFSGLFALSSYALANQSNSALFNSIESMQPGTWLQANVNTFESVWTPPEYRVDNNIGAIIRAWSGAAWDSNRGDLIIYGGGHANYSGNDVYIWHSSNLQWERASLPTRISPVTINGTTEWTTADNGATPQSAHTYDNNVFLPNLDRFLTFGGYTYGNGSPYAKVDENGTFVTTGPYLFNPGLADGNKVGGQNGTGVDPTTPGGNMWQNRDIAGTKIAGAFGEGITAVTQENGKDVVYTISNLPNTYGDALFKYVINDINDPSQDSWSVAGSPHVTTISTQGAGAIDPVNNIFVRTGVENFDYAGTPLSLNFFYWDLNQAGIGNVEKSFNVTDNTGGTFAFDQITNMGLQYDPIGQRFLLWGGGNNVFTLTHLANANFDTGWSLDVDNKILVDGPGGLLAVDPPSGGGILGKWDYASDYGVFVGLKDAINGNVWVYKPSNFQATPEVPLPMASWLFASGLLGFRVFGQRTKKSINA